MSLRLLLDQMIDEEAAGRVRGLGHDVVRVSDIGLAVAPDDAILARARGENRVLVTLDNTSVTGVSCPWPSIRA